MPPCGGPFGHPSPGAGDRNVQVQLRSSIAVAAILLGLVGRRIVTVRSLHLDGAVMVLLNSEQVTEFIYFFVIGLEPLATHGRTSEELAEVALRPISAAVGSAKAWLGSRTAIWGREPRFPRVKGRGLQAF